METIEIREWGQLIEKMAECTQKFGGAQIWWRGHSNSEWNLVPTIYRDSRNKFEQTRCLIFRRKGKTRHSNTPVYDDYVSWLFLMRHYGLYSRLLDWTESPLYALYFAVSGTAHTNQSAALWGLYPGKLNSNQTAASGASVYLARSPEVVPIIKEAFELKKNTQSQKILAIAADEVDIRQMIQMSTFTIHGISTPLEHLEGSDQFLVKFEVPAEYIDTFQQGLLMLGIDASMLFPDLEHLAADLNKDSFTQ